MRITGNEIQLSRRELIDLMDTCLAIGIGVTNESFAQMIANPSKDIFEERLQNMSDTLTAMDKIAMYAPEMVSDLKETYQISKNKYAKLCSA